MRIGQLSVRTGVSARSLRYYEQQGLLLAEREANGYREYDDAAVAAVAAIQDFLGAGLSTDVIRDILPCTAGEQVSSSEACPELLARVVAIRDGLERQAARIAAHTEKLDRYLAGTPHDGSSTPGARRVAVKRIGSE